jgi:hypothetical protein
MSSTNGPVLGINFFVVRSIESLFSATKVSPLSSKIKETNRLVTAKLGQDIQPQVFYPDPKSQCSKAHRILIFGIHILYVFLCVLAGADV